MVVYNIFKECVKCEVYHTISDFIAFYKQKTGISPDDFFSNWEMWPITKRTCRQFEKKTWQYGDFWANVRWGWGGAGHIFTQWLGDVDSC